MAVSSAASVAVCFLTEFYAIVFSYIMIISLASCSSIIIAFSNTLYPVNCRATATSFIALCARLGSVVGGNLVGILLNVECRSIFYVYAAILTSKLYFFSAVLKFFFFTQKVKLKSPVRAIEKNFKAALFHYIFKILFSID